MLRTCFTARLMWNTDCEIEIISSGAGKERTLRRFSLCHKCDTIYLSSFYFAKRSEGAGESFPCWGLGQSPKYKTKRGNDMRYDVLLCDADNTLFDFNKAEENAFAIACEQMGFSSTPELLATYSKINEALWKLLEQGGITQEVLRVRRFEQFLEAIHRNDDAQKMCDAFVDALGRQSVPLDGAVEAVKRWSAKVPVIIVTNGIGQVQRGRMAGSELRPYVSGLVISEEDGAAKPNPLMLEKGMELAHVTDRRRALMLGDSLTSDMAAARNAGIDACWFNPKGAANDKGVPIAYEIASLDEVDAILDGTEE